MNTLVGSEHALDQIHKRPIEILATCQAVFINKQHIVFETGVEMRLEAQLDDDRVMVTVDMGIDSIHSFEELTN
jgi:hypothetical protein